MFRKTGMIPRQNIGWTYIAHLSLQRMLDERVAPIVKTNKISHILFIFAPLLSHLASLRHSLWRWAYEVLLSPYQGCGSVFIFFRIRIQSMMLETNTDPDPDPDPDPIRIQGFNDQKLEKNYSWKFFFYIFFWSKTAIYLSLGLH